MTTRTCPQVHRPDPENESSDEAEELAEEVRPIPADLCRKNSGTSDPVQAPEKGHSKS